MMKKIKQLEKLIIPEHIAIILDGNGRWAKKRHMPRTYGHQRGVENIRNITLAASDLGVKALSVYAFSTENWSRPKAEVDFLMKLPGEFENIEILERITNNTKERQGLVLNICFDYGSQSEITEAVRLIAQDVLDKQLEVADITKKNIENYLYTKDLPKLDLLIRPSGELRLSNFLLWQAAYAELYFTKTFWPAFSKKDLEQAIIEFNKRERRYGGLKK